MPDTPDTEGQEAPEQQPPEQVADTAESVNADATPGDGPWAADLAAAFEDPAQRKAVDEFLRTTVQPRVTQLEQATAGNRHAERLYQDFTERPEDTYYSVTQELFGDEAAEAVREALAGNENAPDADDDILSDFEGDLSDLPAEAREAIEYVQEQRQEQAFNAEIDRIKQDKPDLDLRPDLFYPFVTAADGDLDVAVENYEQFLNEFKGTATPPPTEEAPDPAESAPATVGTDRTGTSVPPTEQNYGSMDEALDAFFDEQDQPPTTVGNV